MLIIISTLILTNKGFVERTPKILKEQYAKDLQKFVKQNDKECFDRLDEFCVFNKGSNKSIILVDPMSYFDFNYLVKNSICVITDSGGITEETTVMGIPCITLRENTERPETIEIGTNELVGTSPDKLILSLNKLFSGNWAKGSIPKYWDGKTSIRIIKSLLKIFAVKY